MARKAMVRAGPAGARRHEGPAPGPALQLSIGQRQRVAVVRALVHRPAVVFADEPTASLDRSTGRHVIDLLAEYRRESGGSVVVVTHDPDMLVGADRLLHMRDGRPN